MTELFIYWRLARQDLRVAQEALHHWHAALEANWPGLVACLYVRSDEAGDPVTLMETYACPGAMAGIAPTLQELIVSQGATITAPWCREVRHVERFAPLPR